MNHEPIHWTIIMNECCPTNDLVAPFEFAYAPIW